MKKVLWLKDHGEEDVDEDISSNTDNWRGSVETYIKTKLKSKDLIIEIYASTAELLRPKKRAKNEHLSSITVGYLA
jgi:hypothetical protein